jgi:Inhibitor of growth proteins N-terminal histone-binding
MSTGDETYLEAFIENLSTLPHEVRRNLDHIKDLDHGSDLLRLRQLQEVYILAAERKVLQLPVVEMGGEQEGSDNADDYADDKSDNNGDSTMKDVPKEGKRRKYGIRVPNEDGTVSNDNPVIIPTRDELMEYIHHHHSNGHDDKNFEDKTMLRQLYGEIRALEQECLQKADEKVAVGQQAYEMIDAKIQRLDADLEAMEKLLQVGWFGNKFQGWLFFLVPPSFVLQF